MTVSWTTCNDLIDDNQQMWWCTADADNDGYGTRLNAVCELPAGAVLNNTDCDDNNSAVFPQHPRCVMAWTTIVTT